MKIEMENVNYYMFRNIDKLLNSGKLEGKKIVLFGLNTSSYAAKGYLESQGKSVFAYIDNDAAKVDEINDFIEDVLPGHMAGQSYRTDSFVKAYFPEQLLQAFSHEFVILIASKYYSQMLEQLRHMGYEENVHVFKTVDFHGLEEIISDFKVGDEYREMTDEEVRSSQISILKRLRKVCEDNHLRYYLCGGTLIGAVRHKGYIPWDDDIDVIMPYGDYKRFIDIMRNDEEYAIQSQYTTPDNCFHFFAKMTDRRTMMKWWDYPFLTTSGVNIDIFALSGLPEKESDIKHFYNRVRRLNTKYIRTYTEATEETGEWTDKRNALRKEILEMLERYDFDKSEKAFCITQYKEREILPVKLYENKVKMRFEDDEYDVAAGYDTYLRALYGDYMEMPPENKRKSYHNYKAYILKA